MKHFLLALFGCIAILLSASVTKATAATITVDDLDGKIAGMIFLGNNAQYGAPSHGQGGYFQKTGTNTLNIINFYNGVVMPCTLSNNRLQITTDQYFDDGLGGRVRFVSAGMYKYSTNITVGYDTYTNCIGYTKYSTDGGSGNQLILQSDPYEYDSESGLYRFKIDDNRIWLDQTRGTSPKIYNSVHIFVMEPGAEAVEYLNGEESARYPVSFGHNGNTISIGNLMEYGLMYENFENTSHNSSKKIVTLDIADNGTDVTMEPLVSGGHWDYYPLGYRTVTLQGTRCYGYWVSDSGEGYFRYTGGEISNDNIYDVTGQIVNGSKAPEHTFAPNYWTPQDNGTLKTFVNSEKIELGYMQTVFGNSIGNPEREADRIEIIPYDGINREVTHSASLNISNMVINPGSGRLTLDAEICNRKNNDYIKDYDLFVIPAEHHTSINSESFIHDNENGHANAVKIANIPVTARAATLDASVDIHNKALTDKLLSKPTEKTFFLKANYAPEHQLHSTFHALTPNSDVITGLGETTMERLEITVNDGSITVAGTEGAPVEIYTPAGALVYSGEEGTIELAPGMYIVRAGTLTEKVNIR